MPSLRSSSIGTVSRVLLAALATSAVAAGCHEAVTGPRELTGVTPEGVIVAARISRETFRPGDTVWATVVLRNPGAAAVTLRAALPQLQGESSSELGVCARWVSPRRRFLTDEGSCAGYVSDVATDLLVPARDSLTYEFSLVGDEAMAEGKYTFWGEIGLHDASSPSDSLLLVDSNPVSVTLSK